VFVRPVCLLCCLVGVALCCCQQSRLRLHVWGGVVPLSCLSEQSCTMTCPRHYGELPRCRMVCLCIARGLVVHRMCESLALCLVVHGRVVLALNVSKNQALHMPSGPQYCRMLAYLVCICLHLQDLLPEAGLQGQGCDAGVWGAAKGTGSKGQGEARGLDEVFRAWVRLCGWSGCSSWSGHGPGFGQAVPFVRVQHPHGPEPLLDAAHGLQDLLSNV
jgi:hypothetical protein